MSVTINGTNGLTFNDASTQTTAATGFGFKNRIINGAMVIDQRNAGASVTVNSNTNFFSVDRWYGFGQPTDGVFTLQQNAGSVTPPVGFINYLGATVTTADASIGATQVYRITQAIEGLNCTDLAWGTANAQTVTLSFWVRSSLTGTFGGNLSNSGFSRAYPFTYTISAANTWEQKSITITGDTTGTWLTNNGAGIQVSFVIGMGSSYVGTPNAWNAGTFFAPTGGTNIIGTNGATFYITGVQLEKGSTATSFDYRPYGTELALCQRYYYKVVTAAASPEVLAPSGFADSTTTAFCWTQFPVSMRTAPTALEQTGTAANYQVRYTGGSSANCSSVPTFNAASVWGARSVFTVASGLTGGQSVVLQTASTAGIYLAWSAEL